MKEDEEEAEREMQREDIASITAKKQEEEEDDDDAGRTHSVDRAVKGSRRKGKDGSLFGFFYWAFILWINGLKPKYK